MGKKLLPVHPGLFLKELMTEYGLTQYALAGAINVQPIRIGHIVAAKRAITPDTALRLARYFGTDAQSWLNLQQQYDIHCAQDSLGKALAAIRPWRDAKAAA